MSARFLVTLAICAFAVTGTYGAVMREYEGNSKARVPVLVNTVGPFNNPAETYPYYDLPYCSPKVEQDRPDSNLGETLAGDRRRQSLYDIRFLVPVAFDAICDFTLTLDDIRKFSDAIENHWIFEMFVDDLPVKGFVGEMETTQTKFDKHTHTETHYYLFTHLDFSIAYNGNNIIAVNLTTDPQTRLELPQKVGSKSKPVRVEFSYSVQWVPTEVAWVDRMSLHSKSAIGDQSEDVHWLSIINSFVLVILLTVFLGIILVRVLNKDFAKYMEVDPEELGQDGQEEGGWKLVHTDVFRPPKHIMLFASAIGVGAQMLVLLILILGLALLGTFYPGNRGSVYSAAVFGYAITAGIAGYISTYIYLQLGGEKWASNTVLTACLFAVPFFAIFVTVNSVAVYYGSSSALPFQTIATVFCLWALVTFPLTILGGVRARNKNPTFEAPCKTRLAVREIPPLPWYRSIPVQMFIAGFLPFSAIYIELHYIFASVWGHRVYTLFGILSLAFVMLIIVTAFITVALTYFQLASEDYRWWWRSFLSGSSTGVFMYAYAWFYYSYRSEMSGSLQGVFFFGYMLAVSYAFALMLGAVGYWMALKFVRHIYLTIKVD